MEKYQVIIKQTAEQDLLKHKISGDVASIKKILRILNELKEHPYTGVGKPEELKHELKGF